MGWPSKFNSWILTSAGTAVVVVAAAVAAAAIDIHDASLTAAAGKLMLIMHVLLFGVMFPSDVSCQIMRAYIGTVTKLPVIHVFLS